MLGIEQSLLPRADLRTVAPEALDAEAEAAARMIRDRWDMGANAIPNIHEMLEDHGVLLNRGGQNEGVVGASPAAAWNRVRKAHQ